MARSIKARSAANAAAGEQNGNARLLIIADAIEHYSKQGDWTDIAWNIAHQKSERDATLVRDIVQAACGLRFKECSKQPSGYKAVRNKEAAETNNLGLLVSYHESGVSFRSDALRSDDDGLPALLEEKLSSPKVRTPEEIILAAVRKIRKDTPELATDARMIAALQSALAAE